MPMANGAYRLKLHFAECRYTKRGQRLFDIALFGIPMIRRYDAFASAGGAAKADVQVLHTIIRNGTLSLSFASVTSANASIAAIEIERLM
jgi:hypothetical protein